MFFLVFSLIKTVVWLVLLPFKILWEIAEHSSRRRHYRRRRRPPARRSVPPMQQHRTLASGPQGQRGPGHWQSLSPGRKTLIIALPVSVVVLLIAVGSAMGSPGSAGPSRSRSVAAQQAPASMITAATTPSASPSPTVARRPHHKARLQPILRRRHHHHHHPMVVAAPTTAPPPRPSAWCTASAVYNSQYNNYDVYVHSNQPNQTVTATASNGETQSYDTNTNGYADVYLYADAGNTITVTVGAATCSTTA